MVTLVTVVVEVLTVVEVVVVDVVTGNAEVVVVVALEHEARIRDVTRKPVSRNHRTPFFIHTPFYIYPIDLL